MSEMYVGFHGAEITPKVGGIALGGYGATQYRLATRVIHPLQGLCTAVKKDELTLLFLTVDLINVHDSNLNRWRKKITERTGVPEDQIIISGTHTHSGPAFEGTGNVSKYLEELDQTLPEICACALNDLKPATLSYGKIKVGNDTTRFNFVRHYKMTDIEFKDHPEDGPVYYAGDNSGIQYSRDLKKYCYTGHAWDADDEMQLLSFERKDADTIVWINFQAHATQTGAMDQFNMSSDFPYTTRCAFEKTVPNVKAVYMQGCCGNINPRTRLAYEGIPGITHDQGDERPLVNADAYGGILAMYARRCFKKLTPGTADDFKYKKLHVAYNCDHHEDSRVEIATKIRDVFEKEGRTPNVWNMCFENGFNSPYHCASVIAKSKLPEKTEVELNAIRIGNIGMITAPFEVFDKTGVRIKEGSPFDQTMLQGYSCGGWAYIPCKEAPENCYERNITRFEPGTAEQMEADLLSMLKELK